MDAISILNGIKNKILDAKNYELLKHTYDLQNQNIEQLKTSNEGFKEDNQRLRGEVDGLIAENESLKQTVAELTQKISQLSEGNESSGLSEAALAILHSYHQRDETCLGMEGEIIPDLKSKFTKIQIESAIDELKTAVMIRREGRWEDVYYSLTEKGKKDLAENFPSE